MIEVGGLLPNVRNPLMLHSGPWPHPSLLTALRRAVSNLESAPTASSAAPLVPLGTNGGDSGHQW